MLFNVTEITLPPIENKCEGPKFEELKGNLSSKMFSQRLETFDAEASREGPWKPLSQVQQENRDAKLGRVSRADLARQASKGFTRVKILQDKGILRQSFTPDSGPGNAFRHVEIGEDFVRISTNVKYARIQNQGGVIVPVKAKALSFMTASGQRVFAKKVTIPARPFDQFTDEQEKELAELTELYLNGKL